MSSGTGVGFLDDSLNAVTNIFTAGVVGFDEDGLGTGILSDAAIDVTKEITGAKAAEEANALAREQAEQARAQAEQDRQNAISDDQRRNLQASRRAGSVRNNSGDTSSGNVSNLGNQTDFLGL